MNSRRSLRILLTLALATFAGLIFRFRFVCDDAFISFRFADRFASGRGLSYNDGVVPPVEGYTELLWVLLLAGARRLGWALEWVAPALSASAGIALFWFAVRALQRRSKGDDRPALVAAFLLGTCVPLAVWSTGGMATLPFALAVFCMIDALCGHGERPKTFVAACAACLAVTLRADGALWVAFVGSAALWHSRKGPTLRRPALTMAGAALAVFLMVALWRHSYYGEWLPNTAKVKLGVSSYTLQRGSHYVLGFFLAFPGLLGLWLATRLRAGRQLDPWGSLLWWSLPFAAAYAIYTGGDFMCFGRFLVPALAPLLVVFADRAGTWRPGQLLAAIALLLGLLPALDVHPVPFAIRATQHFRYNSRNADGSDLVVSEFQQWKNMQQRAREWSLLGQAVAQHTDPGDSFVMRAIGAFGYYSQRRIFDRYGLVSPEVLTEPRTMNPSREERRSPGHDRFVPVSFFLPARPTWLGAEIAPPGMPPPRGLRPGLDRWVELDPARGFEPGAHLVLYAGPR